MISSHWNSDTASSRFVTSQPSPLDEIDKTMPGLSVPFDPEFVAEHKPLEPNPHHRVPQILFLFGRRNEMWVRVSPADPGIKEHQHIQRVTIFTQRRGDEAEVKREHRPFRQNAAQPERPDPWIIGE